MVPWEKAVAGEHPTFFQRRAVCNSSRALDSTSYNRSPSPGNPFPLHPRTSHRFPSAFIRGRLLNVVDRPWACNGPQLVASLHPPGAFVKVGCVKGRKERDGGREREAEMNEMMKPELTRMVRVAYAGRQGRRTKVVGLR